MIDAILPHFQTLRRTLAPSAAPYWAAVDPYLGEGKQWLDAVSEREFVLLIVGIFGSVLLLQIFFALTATCRRGANGLKAFSPTVFWYTLCFIVHSWIEYNFVYNRSTDRSGFKNGLNLYGAADFRYGIGQNLELEPGTAAMEMITALVSGPLCLLTAWAIVGNKPWRWTLQIMSSMCHLYGLVWFMAHPFFAGSDISSSDPFLYWVIFVGFNAPWGIIPPILLLQAVFHLNRNMAILQQQAQVGAAAVKAVQQQKKFQ